RALEPAAGDRSGGRRIVNLVLRAQRQQGGKIALAHQLRWYRADEGLRHAEVVPAVAVEPEGPVLAVIQFWQINGRAGDQAPAVVRVVWDSLPRAILEDIRRIEHRIA